MCHNPGLCVVGQPAYWTLPALCRSLDVRGDGLWGYQRLQTCESLGRAPNVLLLGSSRTLFSADAHHVDDTMRTLADYQDSHHLTASGAVKFSTWMARAIVAPALGATSH